MALVAEAAHELRAPLSAALLGLHGVVADAPAARRVAAVELELRRAGLALADLDAAPRGRRAPELAEPLEVRALLAEAVEGWRPLAGALGGELLFDPAGSRLLVHADRLRLTQAVGNLVLNALEHGAGPVRVRAHGDAHARAHRGARPGPGPAGAGRRARGGRDARRPPRPRPRDRRARGAAPRRPPAHGAGQRRRVRGPRAPAGRRRSARTGCRGRGAGARVRAVSRRRRAAALLGLALVLGGLAASDVARREAAVRAQLGPAVDVVVARADIAAGRPVAASDLGGAQRARALRARRRRHGARDADRAAARRAGPARRLPRRRR